MASAGQDVSVSGADSQSTLTMINVLELWRGSMATVADYQVLHSSGGVLDALGAQDALDLTWQIPTNIVEGTNRAKPLLVMMVQPLEDCRFNVRVNNRELASPSLDKSHTRVWQHPFSWSEAFPNNASFPNANPVRIRVSSGRLRIDHVIMWFQVDV